MSDEMCARVLLALLGVLDLTVRRARSSASIELTGSRGCQAWTREAELIFASNLRRSGRMPSCVRSRSWASWTCRLPHSRAKTTSCRHCRLQSGLRPDRPIPHQLLPLWLGRSSLPRAETPGTCPEKRARRLIADASERQHGGDSIGGYAWSSCSQISQTARSA